MKFKVLQLIKRRRQKNPKSKIAIPKEVRQPCLGFLVIPCNFEIYSTPFYSIDILLLKKNKNYDL